MAKPFTLYKEPRKPKAKKVKAAKSKEDYNWDEWFNGEVTLIEQSDGVKDDKGNVVEVTDKRDFNVSIKSMMNNVKSAARKRYKVVEFNHMDSEGSRIENGFILRARDMDDDEKKMEDALREKYKQNIARMKEAKDKKKAGKDKVVMEGTENSEEAE